MENDYLWWWNKKVWTLVSK